MGQILEWKDKHKIGKLEIALRQLHEGLCSVGEAGVFFDPELTEEMLEAAISHKLLPEMAQVIQLHFIKLELDCLKAFHQNVK